MLPIPDSGTDLYAGYLLFIQRVFRKAYCVPGMSGLTLGFTGGGQRYTPRDMPPALRMAYLLKVFDIAPKYATKALHRERIDADPDSIVGQYMTWAIRQNDEYKLDQAYCAT